MCQEDRQPEAKVQIEASPKAADLILKAVLRAVVGEFPEQGDEFAEQNEASKRLVDDFDQAFDIMVSSLAKQVDDVLKQA